MRASCIKRYQLHGFGTHCAPHVDHFDSNRPEQGVWGLVFRFQALRFRARERAGIKVSGYSTSFEKARAPRFA